MSPQLDRRGLGFWIALVAGVVLLASLAAIGLSAAAVNTLSDARVKLIVRVGPVRTANFQLLTAMLNQETGVRGYLLSAQPTFLTPYRTGQAEQATQSAIIDASTQKSLTDIRPQFVAYRQAIAAWQDQYAKPTIARVRAGQSARVAEADVARGKRLFDALRARQRGLADALQAQRDTSAKDLEDSVNDLKRYLILSAALILVAALAAAVVLRRAVIAPLGRLSSDVREVASGDFDKTVSSAGTREIAQVAADVDTMRRRIVDELGAIREAEERVRVQATELERSNSELEQFAYVASHDLQEPLRKIVSFNQMLERRYKGQLDDRADQYIGFAVDGARRMQVLINDLLAFSRVGRMTEGFSLVSAREIVDDALSGLNAAIEETGATVEVGELPDIRGERSLVTLVVQNLIGNAIKFRGEAPPVVRVSAERKGDEHEFAFADNGIGIAPEYAERIFVIFQRLHPRSEYEGTGIGLAMSRKIIEYHGGRIWLDDSASEGSTFRFTLPAV